MRVVPPDPSSTPQNHEGVPSPISTRLQLLKRDEIECALVRGFQNNGGRHTRIKRFSPAHGAQTPAVIGFQSVKAVFGACGHQIIAARLGELQKRGRHPRANHMRPRIVFARVAAPVTKIASQGIKGTRTQGFTQHIQSRCSRKIRHKKRSRGSGGYPFRGTLKAIYTSSALEKSIHHGASPWGLNFRNVLPVFPKATFRPSFKWLGKIAPALKPFSNAWAGLSQKSYASCGTSYSPTLFGCGASA